MSEHNPSQQSDPSLLHSESAPEEIFRDEQDPSKFGDGKNLMKMAHAHIRRAHLHDSVGRTDIAGAHYEEALPRLANVASLAEDNLAEFGWNDQLDLAKVQMWLATWDNLPTYESDVSEHETEGFGRSADRRENLFDEAEASLDRAIQAARKNGEPSPIVSAVIDLAESKVRTMRAEYSLRHGDRGGARLEIINACANILDAQERIAQLKAIKIGRLPLAIQVRIQDRHVQHFVKEGALDVAA
jgi:hypothetical protein